jgi:hypothetical protein
VTPLWAAIAVPAALVVVALGFYLLTRDPTGTPPPPGKHRQPPRDPHDLPLIDEDDDDHEEE